jgi:hypothetical protein
MIDVPDHGMFTHAGRQYALLGISDVGLPFGLVTTWNDNADQEQNVVVLRNEGEAVVRPGSSQHRNYVYGTDAKGESAIIVLWTNRQIVDLRPAAALPPVEAHCRRLAEQYGQPGFVLWDGKQARFIGLDGSVTPLAAWDGTADRLDELASALRPGFRIAGTFDRSLAYIRTRLNQG